MGSIKKFDLDTLRKEYKIDYFFETGTWKGDGLAFALKFPFQKVFSCEIIQEIYEKVVPRFQGNNKVVLYCGDSEEAIRKLNNEIKGNCIYWLDAHYPGADAGVHSYNEFEKENKRLPLHSELAIIRTMRSEFNDIILIDDLRIYEDGPYKSGNMPDHILPPQIRNINFVYELFADTHEIIKFYNDHGYLVILPKIKVKEIRDTWLKRLFKRTIKKIIYP